MQYDFEMTLTLRNQVMHLSMRTGVNKVIQMIFLQEFRLPHRIYPLHNLYRRYASSASLSPQHSIYISKSINPYFNLTFEDWWVASRIKRCVLLTQVHFRKAIQTQKSE